MKYCPFCGAEMISDEVLFCMECGKKVPLGSSETGSAGEKRAAAKPSKSKKPQGAKKVKKQRAETIPEVMGEPVNDGYDGYYDDVLPPDLDHVKDGLDKELVKKIAALGAVVLLIIALCVIMMYML